MISARVSTIESFRWWWENSDEDFDWFINRLAEPANDKMQAGTAFHKGLELAWVGELSTMEVDGYVFDLSQLEGEISAPQIAEVRALKQYGDLQVSGKTDGISGKAIRDYKLTFSSFDADRYLESYQWRFYLDIFNVDVFDYYVFEAYENLTIGGFDVKRLHPMRLYRYPELSNDCAKLAQKFYNAATANPKILQNAQGQEEIEPC